MPTPLQKRVLLGLKSGLKLHELLRETNMPSKAMVEEWRDNPEFDAEYQQALTDGNTKRNPPSKEPAKRRASANRCPFTFRGQPTTVAGTADDERRMALSGWLTRIIGDGDTYSTPAGKPAEIDLSIPDPLLMSAKSIDSEVKEAALTMLRAGIRSADVLKKVHGLSSLKIAQWRKDAAFASQWDQAKADGRGKSHRAKAAPIPKPAATPILQAEPLLSKPKPKEPAFYQPRPMLGVMPRKHWQEQVAQERVNALRDAMLRYLGNSDPMPADWVEEYNELVSQIPLAA